VSRSGDGSASATGRRAEDAAAAYLVSLGYRVLTRNLRGRGGEIDIVAREDETYVFVEVKARATRAFGSALGAVDARKRRRMRAIAEEYLQVIAPTARARFDVVTVEPDGVALHRNAFTWP
jgi:putative endonuclease